MSTIDQVRIFHQTFNHPVRDQPNLKGKKLRKLRVDLIKEETKELEYALEHRDLVEVLDALCDLQYVLDGAFLVFGLGNVKEAACTEVHRSNMSKAGPDGKPIVREDGKILKGGLYSPPDLEPFIKKYGVTWTR